MSQIHAACLLGPYYFCQLLPNYCLAHLGVMNRSQCVELGLDAYKSISWRKTQNNEGPEENQLKSPGCLPTSLKWLATNNPCTPASLISSDEDTLNSSCTFLHSLNYRVVGGGFQRRGSGWGETEGGRWRKAQEEGGTQITQCEMLRWREMQRRKKSMGNDDRLKSEERDV